MKRQHFIINYAVYPYDLMVVCGYSFSELEKLLKKHLPKESHDEIKLLDITGMGFTYMFDCGATVMCFDARIPKAHIPGVIVHEAFHATRSLMEFIGQELASESDESYAYFIQFLFNEISKKVK